ncbi:MAG: PepSY-associated TM helix domain-containing protein [Pseudomonadota bacterium]
MHGTAPPAQKKRGRKTFWLKQLHTWHWMSSAVSLIGLLLFAVTGFTLNHAGDIEAAPVTREYTAQLPAPLLPQVAPSDAPDAKKPIPAPIATFIETKLPLKAAGDAEWTADTVYLALPRPGGDAWISIDRASGEVTGETTSRGWIAYLNDLHKGRNSGTVWKWFLDIFVGACIVFAGTGLVLLQLHSKHRRSTWPIVGLGLVIPAAIALFFIH